MIEDDENFSWLMKQACKEAGLLLDHAPDGSSGFKKAKATKPDLIILDILLPKMDGISVANAIRQQGIQSPILFLTNFKDQKNILYAAQLLGETPLIKSDVRIFDIITHVKHRLGIE